MLVVADSSPLLYLLLIDQIEVLPHLVLAGIVPMPGYSSKPYHAAPERCWLTNCKVKN